LILICDKIIDFGLIFLILFTPLAFGGVYVWAYSIMELTVFLILIALIVKKGLIQRKQLSFPLFFPFIAFLALILLQMTPLPPPAVKLLSPRTFELYSETLDEYPREMREDRGERQIIKSIEFRGQRSEARGEKLEPKKTKNIFENWRTLSVYPHATRTELLKILSYVGIFLLIINYVDSKRKLMKVSTFIVFSGIIVALLGIAQKIAEAPKIYWFWEPLFKKDASFFGPFVNPNHFAGYMQMVIPLSIGLFIIKWRRFGKEQSGIREFFITMGNEEGCKLILFSFLIVLTVGALFLSSSRGGVISFLGSMIFFLLIIIKREKDRRNVFLVVGLLISFFSFLIWMGIRPLIEEFSSIQDLSKDYDIQYRFQNWKDAIKLFRDFQLFGVGLETFSSIFPKYKTIELQYYYLYLENDYLQLLCALGIFGFGIFLWFIVSFFRIIRSGYSKYDVEGISSIHCVSLYGCLTSVVAIMIHSFWDFNMHIPSNALLLSMLMGLRVISKIPRDALHIQNYHEDENLFNVYHFYLGSPFVYGDEAIHGRSFLENGPARWEGAE
jgi:O-antigen ligase